MTPELLAKIILSVVATVQAVGPIGADLNRTHATNPEWTPHARFHVVWQVLLQTGVSVAALILLWGEPSTANTWIAALLVLNWTVTFFVTVSSRSLFEGTLSDATTGIRPFVFRLGSRSLKVDTNLFGAVVLGTLTLVAVLLLLVQ